ncbi:hypothetical protein DM02DRAFT_333424 [Periconia macrospinosa]|uniref:Uncharacterized protein n=1 Tax=Periconia macrospinosa TaxID=97972 RepID=A0A2V1D0P8_9PLEO|nr:hypothetical protein DM02DRAFT_333424 [Periconia macrospinosa]
MERNSPPGKGFAFSGEERLAFDVSMWHQIHCLNHIRTALVAGDDGSEDMVMHHRHCIQETEKVSRRVLGRVEYKFWTKGTVLRPLMGIPASEERQVSPQRMGNWPGKLKISARRGKSAGGNGTAVCTQVIGPDFVLPRVKSGRWKARRIHKDRRVMVSRTWLN